MCLNKSEEMNIRIARNEFLTRIWPREAMLYKQLWPWTAGGKERDFLIYE